MSPPKSVFGCRSTGVSVSLATLASLVFLLFGARPAVCQSIMPSRFSGPEASRDTTTSAAPAKRSVIPENFALYIDQDVFFPPAFDQDYTMGVQFEYFGSGTGQTWLRRFDYLMGVFPALLHRRWEGADCASAFLWGISAFAPAKGENGVNLERADPIFNDRPYASLLYVRAQHWSASAKNALTTELTFGVLGLDVAKASQTFIHEHISNDVRPGGWHNQISDGGELTGNYRISYRRLLWEKGWGDVTGSPFAIQAVGSLDGSAGYYTNVGFGGRIRFGWWRLENYWWRWERMSIPAILRQSQGMGEDADPLGIDTSRFDGPVTDDRSRTKKFLDAITPKEGFVHASGGATHWRKNVLLEGQWRQSEVTLHYDDPRPDAAPLNRGIYDLQIGLTLGWSRFAASYSIVTHSPVFGGPNERTHVWGGLQLVFRSAG